MKTIFLSLILKLVASVVFRGGSGNSADGGSSSNDEQAQINLIKKMENERVLAGVRKDVEAIAAATAEYYVQIDFDGRVMKQGDDSRAHKVERDRFSCS
jgi:hypothetical protein